MLGGTEVFKEVFVWNQGILAYMKVTFMTHKIQSAIHLGLL